MDLKSNKIDTKRASNGVWVDIDDETSLLLARYRNPAHQAFITKAMQPYLRLQRLGRMDEDVAERIEAEGLAKHVLLGWKGMKDNGVEVPYSEETAIKLLRDPELSWFPELVRELSNDMTFFRAEDLADSVDNVKKLSNGA